MKKILKNKKVLIGCGIFILLLIVAIFFIRLPSPTKKLPEETASLWVSKTDRVDIEIKDAGLHLNPYALPEETPVTITQLDINEGPTEAEYPEFKTLAVIHIEPSVPSLYLNPDDPGVNPALVYFYYPCGQMSQEEQNNLSIASFENGEWVLLGSSCNGDNVSAPAYHLSKFSLVSLVKDFGNQLLEKFKEEFIPVEKIPFKFLYSKLKSIVFLGCKQITFPIAVLERLLTPVGQDYTAPIFNKIFTYFYNIGVKEGYSTARTLGVKPSTGDWIGENTIPQKSDNEVWQKIETEPSIYMELEEEWQGMTHTENKPASYFIEDQSGAIDYARHAYELGFGFGFQQGVYDNGMNQPPAEIALASFYIKSFGQETIEFTAQEGSIMRAAMNPVIAEKKVVPVEVPVEEEEIKKEEVKKEEEKKEAEKERIEQKCEGSTTWCYIQEQCKGTADQSWCVWELAKTTNDVKLCPHAGRFMGNCYSDLAAKNNDPQICVNHWGSPTSEARRGSARSCIFNAAETSRNETFCELLPPFSYEFPIDYTKDECYRKLAVVKKDANLCAKIISGFQPNCYKWVQEAIEK